MYFICLILRSFITIHDLQSMFNYWRYFQRSSVTTNFSPSNTSEISPSFQHGEKLRVKKEVYVTTILVLSDTGGHWFLTRTSGQVQLIYNKRTLNRELCFSLRSVFSTNMSEKDHNPGTLMIENQGYWIQDETNNRKDSDSTKKQTKQNSKEERDRKGT